MPREHVSSGASGVSGVAGAAGTAGMLGASAGAGACSSTAFCCSTSSLRCARRLPSASSFWTTMLMSASPAPAPPAPAIGDGSAGGTPSPAPGAEVDEAAAELLDDAPEEAAEAAFERVARGTKKFALLAAPWRSASAAAARFLSNFVA
jgi:hypothetical protein